MRLLGCTTAPALPEAITVTDVTEMGFEDLQLLVEVHRMVGKAIDLAGGSVPAVWSPQWWDAEPMARLAGLLLLAEQYLIDDPHLIAAQMIKDASVAISSSKDWSAAANLPSHAELARRRAEPGRIYAPFDPLAALRCIPAPPCWTVYMPS